MAQWGQAEKLPVANNYHQKQRYSGPWGSTLSRPKLLSYSPHPEKFLHIWFLPAEAEQKQRQLRVDYYKQLLSLLSALSPEEKEKFVKKNPKLFFNLSHFMAKQKGASAIEEAKDFFHYLPDDLEKFVEEIKVEDKKDPDKIVDTLAG